MREADSSLLLPVATGSTSAGKGREAGICVFAVIEIDNFPIVRRHLGSSAGTAAIDSVAWRVTDTVPGVSLSVIGRDRIELACDSASIEAARMMLERIEAACAAPFEIGGRDCRIELLIGASVAPESEHDELRLVEDAEQALEEARTERQPIVRALLRPNVLDRIALKRDLGIAIAQGALFVHYQPKIHLRRGEVAGVEALLRWRHPVRGLVSPADFIPLAEESRDIVDLTLWTLRQVIEDQLALARMGHDHCIFVNVAGALLGDARFVGAVRDLVPPSGARIGFEITETSVIRDPESAIANLKLFAAMGIAVAIDDYGAGLSSLAYLKQLPASELKIDKLFITQLTSSNRDPLIVRSTIDLAHALDMAVVAEGVETAATLALLSVMGCDMAQGFLLSRPVALDALVTFMREYSPDSHIAPPSFTGISRRAQEA